MLDRIKNIALASCLIGILVAGNITAAQDFDIMDIVKKDLNERVAPNSNIKNSLDSKNATINKPAGDGEVDFYSYMRDLQRRIKLNWNPPKYNKSKRTIVAFSILKNGRITNIKIHQSSGDKLSDEAALAAVKVVGVFRPLPKEYTDDKIDVQFTFGYNVFGRENLPRKK